MPLLLFVSPSFGEDQSLESIALDTAEAYAARLASRGSAEVCGRTAAAFVDGLKKDMAGWEEAGEAAIKEFKKTKEGGWGKVGKVAREILI